MLTCTAGPPDILLSSGKPQSKIRKNKQRKDPSVRGFYGTGLFAAYTHTAPSSGQRRRREDGAGSSKQPRDQRQARYRLWLTVDAAVAEERSQNLIMKRKEVKVVKMSPNEHAQWVRQEQESRRRLRIQQVREQQRHIARSVRQSVEQRRQQELSLLEEQLRQQWEQQQEERLHNLHALYQENLLLLGQGHRNAQQNEVDMGVILQQQQEDQQKAEERYHKALKELQLQKLQQQQSHSRSTEARRRVLQLEKIRAAEVARLPPRPPQALHLQPDPRPQPVVRRSNASSFAASHYHMPEATVGKEGPASQASAREEAELEAQRVELLKKEEQRRSEEQREKARLRGIQALRREQQNQERGRLLQQLEHLHQTDLLRRRHRALLLPLHRTQDEQEELQRDMELAFQHMYSGERRVKGDLLCGLVPEPLPPPSTDSLCPELDVSQDEPPQPQLQEDDPRTGSVQESSSAAVPLEAADGAARGRPGLKRLLTRIQSQRRQWSESEGTAPSSPPAPPAPPDLRTDPPRSQRIDPKDTSSLDTGSLTIEDQPSKEETEDSITSAKQLQEIEEQKKKELLEVLHRERLEQEQILEQLERQRLELEKRLTEAQRESAALKAPSPEPVDSNPEPPTPTVEEHRRRLLQQNVVHQKTVEVARQRLEEYQRALRLRHNTAPRSTLPAPVPAPVPASAPVPAPVPAPAPLSYTGPSSFLPAVPSALHLPVPTCPKHQAPPLSEWRPLCPPGSDRGPDGLAPHRHALFLKFIQNRLGLTSDISQALPTSPGPVVSMTTAPSPVVSMTTTPGPVVSMATAPISVVSMATAPDAAVVSMATAPSAVVSMTTAPSPVVSIRTSPSPVVSMTTAQSSVVSMTTARSSGVSMTTARSPVVSITTARSPVVSMTSTPSPVSSTGIGSWHSSADPTGVLSLGLGSVHSTLGGPGTIPPSLLLSTPRAEAGLGSAGSAEEEEAPARGLTQGSSRSSLLQTLLKALERSSLGKCTDHSPPPSSSGSRSGPSSGSRSGPSSGCRSGPASCSSVLCLPSAGATKPPVSRTWLGCVDSLHELSVIPEVTTPASLSLLTGADPGVDPGADPGAAVDVQEVTVTDCSGSLSDLVHHVDFESGPDLSGSSVVTSLSAGAERGARGLSSSLSTGSYITTDPELQSHADDGEKTSDRSPGGSLLQLSPHSKEAFTDRLPPPGSPQVCPAVPADVAPGWGPAVPAELAPGWGPAELAPGWDPAVPAEESSVWATEGDESFRPLVGELLRPAEQEGSGLEQILGQPSAHSSVIAPPGSGWESSSGLHWREGLSYTQDSTWHIPGQERPLDCPENKSSAEASASSGFHQLQAELTQNQTHTCQNQEQPGPSEPWSPERMRGEGPSISTGWPCSPSEALQDGFEDKGILEQSLITLVSLTDSSSDEQDAGTLEEAGPVTQSAEVDPDPHPDPVLEQVTCKPAGPRSGQRALHFRKKTLEKLRTKDIPPH